MTTALTSVERDLYPAAGVWEIDPAHTTVEFVARHLMVSKVRGRFDSFTGSIEIGEDLVASAIEVDIDVTSLTTGSPDRDAHLASADFFEAGDHPTIRFASTAIEPDGADWPDNAHWTVTGLLTIRGVTQPVTLDLAYLGTGQDPWGNTKAGFSLTGEVDREDWGLTWNVALEGGGVLVSKKVKLEIETQIKQR
ncbi:MAG: YceI family protein [Acidimicrobiia bacterium]